MSFTMSMAQKKLGRNDPCFCGSGNKYKRCCLLDNSLKQELSTNDNMLQRSSDRLKEYVTTNIDGQWTISKDPPEIKISAIILELADELLEFAKKPSQYKSAIAITCIAWNMACFPEKQNEHLNKLFAEVDDDLYKQDATEIINALIEKKNHYYPTMKRLILAYDVIVSRNKYRLNVISTIVDN